MRAVLSLLTALTLLVEGTTGWCCHPPVHDEECCTALMCCTAIMCCTALIPSDACNCCQHHAQTTQRDGQQPAGPCQGEPKCQGICIFLPSQKPLMEMPQPDSLFDVAGMLPARSSDPLATTAIGYSLGDPFDAESPPRLYLLHRTFLI